MQLPKESCAAIINLSPRDTAQKPQVAPIRGEATGKVFQVLASTSKYCILFLGKITTRTYWGIIMLCYKINKQLHNSINFLAPLSLTVEITNCFFQNEGNHKISIRKVRNTTEWHKKIHAHEQNKMFLLDTQTNKLKRKCSRIERINKVGFESHKLNKISPVFKIECSYWVL